MRSVNGVVGLRDVSAAVVGNGDWAGSSEFDWLWLLDIILVTDEILQGALRHDTLPNLR